MRADSRIHALGLTQSREKARALIMAGKVTVNGKPISKPGTDVKEDAKIDIIGEAIPYVSRGGLKLKRAIDVFELSLSGMIAADIGASTGGFTDCMLQEGATKVYAIDVGYGQFDWRLRNDPRVCLMERKNARYMEPRWFLEPLTFASIDVSFISIRLILPALRACLEKDARVVALIKPQFEAGRAEVRGSGVVRDINVHIEVCRQVLESVCAMGFDICKFCYSPVTGPKGNIEFLVLLEKSPEAPGKFRLDVSLEDVIKQAHKTLNIHKL